MTTNSKELGLPRQRLDEIELRLLGADHRPWVLGVQESMRDANGKALVMRYSNTATKKALNASLCTKNGIPTGGIYHNKETEDFRKLENEEHVNPRVYRSELGIFQLCGQATDEMGDFVAHAPQDVEDLLNEVKFLRLRLEKSETQREEMKKELLQLRLDHASISQKWTEARGSWNTFRKNIGDKFS